MLDAAPVSQPVSMTVHRLGSAGQGAIDRLRLQPAMEVLEQLSTRGGELGRVIESGQGDDRIYGGVGGELRTIVLAVVGRGGGSHTLAPPRRQGGRA